LAFGDNDCTRFVCWAFDAMPAGRLGSTCIRQGERVDSVWAEALMLYQLHR
jgi:hypothetical protein